MKSDVITYALKVRTYLVVCLRAFSGAKEALHRDQTVGPADGTRRKEDQRVSLSTAGTGMFVK